MKYKTKPYKHQRECLKKFGNFKAFALLAEMGTGKTWIIINNVAKLWEQGKCYSLLVLAPNGVHTNWTRLEIPAHMPDAVDYYAAAWNASGRKADVDELYNIPDGTLKIFTMNWEALQHKKGIEAANKFCSYANKLMIVCDESDSVKNPSAKRTKVLMKLRAYTDYRRIMTGTPINNAPFDAFSQYNFLDKSILDCKSFCAFKAEYAEMLPPGNALVEHIRKKSRRPFTLQVIARGPEGKPKYRNLNRLSKLIAPYSYRILKSECLNLPDKIYKTLLFDLTPQQKEAYRKAEKECRLVFEGEETPFIKLVVIQKLAQITSGYYIHPMADDPVRIPGKTPKLDMLSERVIKIVESGNSIIIWARYRIEIEDIIARLRKAEIEYVQFHGGIKKKAREAAIDLFENKKVPVFVGNPQAAGKGLTLVAANYVVYYSNSYSMRDRAQSEDRAHRIGQSKNVTYINIAAKGTIDEVVIRALKNKKNVAETIIDHGLALFTE